MITYTEEKKFTKQQVQQLFLSVNWTSGNYPERLYRALLHSSTVLTAWDGDRLVGLIRALDDTAMLAQIGVQGAWVGPLTGLAHAGRSVAPGSCWPSWRRWRRWCCRCTASSPSC